MNPRSIRPISARIRPIPATLLAAALAAALPLAAQEVVDVTGRDQRLDVDFEEVFRVGVLRGQSWEMFGSVREVGFDAQGNLYVFDGLGDGERDCASSCSTPPASSCASSALPARGPGSSTIRQDTL